MKELATEESSIYCLYKAMFYAGYFYNESSKVLRKNLGKNMQTSGAEDSAHIGSL